MGVEQNNEQLNKQATAEELLEKANSYILNSTPEDIKNQLESEESKQEFVKRFKQAIILEGELDRNNYFETVLIQTLGRLIGTYTGEINGNWGDETQKSYLAIFTPEEQAKIKLIGEGLIKGEEQETVEIEAEEKLAIMLSRQLEKAGIKREIIEQIIQKANQFKETFPELELYLGQEKLKEAIDYLEKNKNKIEEIQDESLKSIFYSTIEALKYAEIINNPEKIEFLKEKQKIEIVLDCFEIINSDENVFSSLKNEKELYYKFKDDLTKILTQNNLTKEQLNKQVKEYIDNFINSEIHRFVYTKNPVKNTKDPRIDIHYRDTVIINDKHIERIKQRFLKFQKVLEQIDNNKQTSREELYSKAINLFVDTKTDNPFKNKDLGFARKEMLQTLKAKMLNTFLSDYEKEFDKQLKEKYSKEKLEDLRKEIKEELLEKDENKNLSQEKLEEKVDRVLIAQLNTELEADIITNLLKNKNITGTKRENLNRYIDFFDPKNEFGELSIAGKNALVEETLSIPLTAFVVGRLSKIAFGARNTLAIDFAEGATFELLTRARQTRGSFKNYSTYDFMVGSAIGAGLFYAMKLEKIGGVDIKFDGNAGGLEGLKNRGLNHLTEASIFTTIEGVGTGIAYQENIFKDGINEKLLTNLGILYLVKLGYKPRDLGGILPDNTLGGIDLKTSSVRAKGQAKMKGVGAGKIDGVGNLRIKDVLRGNIENVMKGFRGLDSQITTDFQSLLLRQADTKTLEQEAIKLIKHQVDAKVRELELEGIKIQTQGERDYIRNYKLERIAEFKKLLESRENGQIPEKLEMNFLGKKWTLELSNPKEMNEYFGKFVEKYRGKETIKKEENINIRK